MGAFDTYSEFQSAIGDWLARADLTTQIPYFITLAERELNAKHTLFSMETVEYVETVAGSAYITYPARYKSLRWLRLNQNDADPLDFLTSEQFTSDTRLFTAGVPDKYSLHGDRIQVGPIPTGVFELEAGVVRKHQELSVTVTSNWWLENMPGLLLYTALKHAEPYLKNDERVQTWHTLRELEEQSLIALDDAQRFPVGGGLTVRTAKGRSHR
jgi:hypothetical protein